MENTVKIIMERANTVHNKKKEEVNSFNIFSILRMERFEVKTHSLIIYELLNPSGSHGCNNIFLKSFCKIVLDDIFDDSNLVQPYREVSFEFGRIDFVLKVNTLAYNQTVIIEMKIDARDQFQQLQRYSNYDTEATIFYLTPDGHKATAQSTLDTAVKDISFEKHINDWLQDCINKVSQNKNHDLHTILKQYKAIVERLVNRYEEDIEIMDIINCKNDLNSAVLVEESLHSWKIRIMKDFFESLRSKLMTKGIPNNLSDFPISESIENYFTDRATYPKLMFETNYSINGYRMYFIVEIEDCLYCMASIRADNGSPINRSVINDELIKDLNLKFNRDLKNKDFRSIGNIISFYKYIKISNEKQCFKNTISLLNYVNDDLSLRDYVIEEIAVQIYTEYLTLSKVLLSI